MTRFLSDFLSYLTAVLALLGVYLAYDCAVVPLGEQRANAEVRLAETQRRRADEQQAIASARKSEQESTFARGRLSTFLGHLPEHSAAVRLPQLTRQHFEKFGLEPSVIRLNATRPVEGLPGYERAFLGIGMPVVGGMKDLNALLLAVDGLENQYPFVRVLNFSVGPDAEQPGRMVGGVNFVALVRE